MLEDFRLKVFVTVAREKSFTKAAEALGVTQSAVSQSVAAAEKEAGCRLFQRLRGESVLTPAGNVFLSYAEKLLESFSDMEMMFIPVDKTTVRVAADPQLLGYMTGVMLKDFLAVHPQVKLEPAASSEEADIRVELIPINNKRGIITPGYYPSESFAATNLWRALSYFLKPTF
jgi:DNA-binding transcriptional LysR family regulator